MKSTQLKSKVARLLLVGLPLLPTVWSASTEAASVQAGLKSKNAVAQSELAWWKGQPGILVGNADAQLLLKYLNTDSTWQIGTKQKSGFNYVRDSKSLETVLEPGVGSANAFGIATRLYLNENGRTVGERALTPYIFACKPSRNPRGYSAILVSGRDVTSGNWWTRAIVLQGDGGNRLNIHEYKIWGGKVVRTSYKKGETWLLQSVTMAAGQTKKAFEQNSWPRMQNTPNLFAQTREFLVNDPNAGVNDTCAVTVQLTTSKNESWWNKVRNEIVDQLKKIGEQIAKKLLEELKAWFETLVGPIKDLLGNWFKDLLDGIVKWFKGLF